MRFDQYYSIVSIRCIDHDRSSIIEPHSPSPGEDDQVAINLTQSSASNSKVQSNRFGSQVETLNRLKYFQCKHRPIAKLDQFDNRISITLIIVSDPGALD